MSYEAPDIARLDAELIASDRWKRHWLVNRPTRCRLIAAGIDRLPRERGELKQFLLDRDSAEAEIVAHMHELSRSKNPEVRKKYGCGLLGMIIFGLIAKIIVEWIYKKLWPDGI